MPLHPIERIHHVTKIICRIVSPVFCKPVADCHWYIFMFIGIFRNQLLFLYTRHLEGLGSTLADKCLLGPSTFDGDGPGCTLPHWSVTVAYVPDFTVVYSFLTHDQISHN